LVLIFSHNDEISWSVSDRLDWFVLRHFSVFSLLRGSVPFLKRFSYDLSSLHHSGAKPIWATNRWYFTNWCI